MRPFVIAWLSKLIGTNAEFIVPGYLFCLGLGSLIAAVLMVDEAHRHGYKKSDSLAVLIVAYIAGVLGATAVPVVQVLLAYLEEGKLLIRSGLAAYGGLLGGVVGASWYLRKKRLNVWSFLDCCAPSLGLAYFFTRIGCFLAGCDYGIITQQPWAVHFPPGSLAFNDHFDQGLIDIAASGSMPVHPTQLYMSFSGLFLYFVIAQLPNKGTGSRVVAFFVGYAVLRSIIEMFRGDENRGFVGGLSTSQFIAVASTTILLSVWAKSVVQSKKNGKNR